MKKLISTTAWAVTLFCWWASPALSACPAGAIQVAVGANIQAAVQAAPNGSKFCIANGEHRGQSITPKNNQSFYNAGTASLNGSKVLTSWTAEGARWFTPGQTATPPSTSIDECADGYPLCNQALAVYYDDAPLKKVSSKSAVNAGSFWRDEANDRIYIGKNPRDHKVEVTTTQRAFSGSASGVGIYGLVVEKYGSKLQQAAIHGAEGSGWMIDGVTVRLNYAVGIDVESGSTVRNSVIDSNGEMGMACGGTGIVIENNAITNNGGWSGLDMYWEGGGIKCTEVVGTFVTVAEGGVNVVKGTGLDFRGNTVHGNKAVGFWIDEGTAAAKPNSGVVAANNDIRKNSHAGMSFEISRGPAKFYGNTLVGNGVETEGLWGGCVQIYDSANVEIYNNVCDVAAGYGSGMMVISQGDRIADNLSGCSNNFHDNTIVLRGEDNVTGATGDDLARFCGTNQNRYNNNKYFIDAESDKTRPHWAWQANELAWAEWRQRSGQEAQGTITVGLPAVPPVGTTPPVTPPTEPPPVVPPGGGGGDPPFCRPGCVAR